MWTVARRMLGRNDMVTTVTHRVSVSPLLVGFLDDAERQKLLHFAATFVWADGEVAESERRFVEDLAARLGVTDPERAVAGLLAMPPIAGEVDPASVSPALAAVVRRVALDIIAADGRVDRAEMAMFELLDDLLPPNLKDV